MRPLLRDLGAMVSRANLLSRDIKAGCGKCGACSSLSAYETSQTRGGGCTTQEALPSVQIRADERPTAQVAFTSGQSGAGDSPVLNQPATAPPWIGSASNPERRGVTAIKESMATCAALPRRGGRLHDSASPWRESARMGTAPVVAFPDLLPPREVGIYRIRLATEPWELRGCAQLRHAVFCDEQRLFIGSDRDAHDEIALPIAAVSYAMGMADEVVGTVRIHEEAHGVWIGSRLAVAREWRGVHGLSSGLIRAAVRTAHCAGAGRFSPPSSGRMWQCSAGSTGEASRKSRYAVGRTS